MAPAQQSAARARAVLVRWAPPPALAGFTVLLLALFALSYGVGSAAGPVAPGMHAPRTGAGPHGPAPGGGGGMGGMHPGGGR
ncbi:hypothetical protein [Streptomyces sp. cmx-4-9]|uniref:hypothetical protein n=1 Tax=Streptomyces sp. cmx-4-9 TaxID=2790941 RepID=UPI00397FC76B